MLRKLKLQLHKEYAVTEIGLFDSFSNNSYTDESNIDLLVELDQPIGWKFLSLELYIETVFDTNFKP